MGVQFPCQGDKIFLCGRSIVIKSVAVVVKSIVVEFSDVLVSGEEYISRRDLQGIFFFKSVEESDELHCGFSVSPYFPTRC